MAATGSQQVTVDGRVLALTNLDKVLYPATGTTKGEVIAYYAEVGPILLPHVRQRPITRKRWPDGVGLDGDHVNVFFAKNLPKGTPDWVRRYTIQHSDGTNDYPVADDLATLVWLAQLAALELHVPAVALLRGRHSPAAGPSRARPRPRRGRDAGRLRGGGRLGPRGARGREPAARSP